MDYKIQQEDNFCRVFVLPVTFPSGYCFGGTLPAVFQMCDWFNPVSAIPDDGVLTGAEADKLTTALKFFVREKTYYDKSRKYLILCDFGLSIII